MMEMIDSLITVLKRVKNCDKAFNNLEMAKDNSLFNEDFIKFDEEKFNRYRKHVHFLITESIRIIKEEND